RSSGILLHPTSLPSRYGIGDLGEEAFRWVDFLASANQKLWQILPLGPTGFGDSPYQCFSAFAGNPYLISPDKLLADGLLSRSDLEGVPNFPNDNVDYGPVIQYKLSLLDVVYANYKRSKILRDEFESFKQKNSAWLDDFALFMTLKESHGGAVLSTWEDELVSRQPQALTAARKKYADAVESQELRQFLFFRQWEAIKSHAHRHGIKIIGDIPIFVAYDSADVWAHPELFYLDEQGKPTVVAGVPPDYFSATGQLWGNPLYRWDVLKKNNYVWWIERFRATLAVVDIVRLDHFRGFEAYWEIPFGMPTAEVGKWVKGPGADFFNGLKSSLGDLPVYSGTHDNDTTRGWYESSSTERERDFARRYLGRDGADIAWDLIRLAFSSVADMAVAPLQDILNLGTQARMNLPGRASGNWGWRFAWNQINDGMRERLKEMAMLYGR
ncbi:MAG: 4-alpha-glucanotransferase, partial [Chloroflexi bacterium]|nr:4-alpha-glucanotransferase [Chloroflexota bacterium]